MQCSLSFGKVSTTKSIWWILSDSNREGLKTRDLQSPPDTITGLSIQLKHYFNTAKERSASIKI